MKKSRGCSSSMWLWTAVTSIPCSRRARSTGFTSAARSTKSPVIAAFPAPVGWNHDVLFPDRVGPRHAHLIHATVDFARVAKHLSDTHGVDAERTGGRRSRTSGRCGSMRQIDGRADGLRELDGVSRPVNVHVVDARGLVPGRSEERRAVA